jgi:hypothetical protein
LRALLALLALLVVAGSAAADTLERDVPVANFAEKNVQLTQGQRVNWSLSVTPSAKAYYDVHSHSGQQVTTYASGNFTGSLGDVFAAPQTNLYSWLVGNYYTPGTLHVAITTDAPGAQVPAPTPVPVGVGLAAFALAAVLGRARIAKR